MKACVTGGCGFVGRHLVNRLLARGDEVTVVDDLSTGTHPSKWLHRPPAEAVWFYWDVRRFFEAGLPENYDVVFHLAAVVGGRMTIEGDPLAVATDLSIDAELFNWIVQARKIPKLIYFSSSAVYPICMQSHMVKNHLTEPSVRFDGLNVGIPDMTYGWAKLTGELLAQYAAEKYDLDVKIYRPFSGYGEDQSFDYPFPSVIGRVINGCDPVTVWGSGGQTRDFIYIEDVIDCVFATMDKLKSNEPLNIGSGEGTSFTQLARMAGAKRVVNDMTKPEGVFYRVASTVKMRQFYTPTTSLAAGIAKVKEAMLTQKAA